MAGKTDLDKAKAAMIAEAADEFFMTPREGTRKAGLFCCILLSFVLKIECCESLQNPIAKNVYFQAVEKYATEIIPNIMTRLENLVGDKGFFVGDQVTMFHMHIQKLYQALINPDGALICTDTLMFICKKRFHIDKIEMDQVNAVIYGLHTDVMMIPMNTWNSNEFIIEC